MYPVLFTIGDIKVYSSVAFLIIAVAAGLIVGRIESSRIGASRHGFWLYTLFALPIVLIFASLNGLLFEVLLWNIVQNYEFTGSGGFVSYGAILGALAWGYVLAKLTKQSAAETLDAIAVILPLILGIYRIGCLLNGCCYGTEIGGSLASAILEWSDGWEPRYPTQIMMMVLNLGIFAWLIRRRRSKVFQGELTVTYLALYSAGRLGIDALRDLPRVLGPLSLHQLSAIAILLITIGISSYMWKTDRFVKTESSLNRE